MINSRNLDDLHPHVRELAKKHIASCKAKGINLLVTSTLRDDEYQATLYAQGRTKPGGIVTNLKVTGAHGFGLAYDVVPLTTLGKAEWNNNKWWNIIGEEGKKLGLEWGGDWKSFVDKPHFQLTEGLTTNDLRHPYNKRPSFWFGTEKKPDPAPTVPEWKLEGLRSLHEAGIVSDLEGWIKKIDEPFPTWAVFAVLDRIYKEMKSNG